MEKIKCITFDKAAQDVLSEQIKAKMKANMSKPDGKNTKSCVITLSISLENIYPVAH